MFCRFCGKQIEDDSQFCSGCGKSQGAASNSAQETPVINVPASTPARGSGRNVPVSVVAPANASSELSKQAVQIYLHDVLAIELAIQQMSEKKLELEEENKHLNVWKYGEDITYPRKPLPPTEPRTPYQGEYAFSDCWDDFMNTENVKYPIFLAAGVVGFITLVATAVNNGFFNGLMLGVLVAAVIFGIGIGVYFVVSMLRHRNDYSYRLELYRNTEMPAYQKKVQQYENQMKQYNNTCEYVTAQRTARSKEAEGMITANDAVLGKLRMKLRYAKNMLETAYSANIIPVQYRKLSPVYFLHDYISSSREGLTDALLQCKLDSIDQKLAHTIKQNSTIILQNAVQIAQNAIQIAQNKQIIENQETIIDQQGDIIAEQRVHTEQQAKIISQNQKILEAERQNAANSAQAAEYARISAINSETTSFFATYDFIKNS